MQPTQQSLRSEQRFNESMEQLLILCATARLPPQYDAWRTVPARQVGGIHQLEVSVLLQELPHQLENWKSANEEDELRSGITPRSTVHSPEMMGQRHDVELAQAIPTPLSLPLLQLIVAEPSFCRDTQIARARMKDSHTLASTASPSPPAKTQGRCHRFLCSVWNQKRCPPMQDATRGAWGLVYRSPWSLRYQRPISLPMEDSTELTVRAQRVAEWEEEARHIHAQACPEPVRHGTAVKRTPFISSMERCLNEGAEHLAAEHVFRWSTTPPAVATSVVVTELERRDVADLPNKNATLEVVLLFCWADCVASHPSSPPRTLWWGHTVEVNLDVVDVRFRFARNLAWLSSGVKEQHHLDVVRQTSQVLPEVVPRSTFTHHNTHQSSGQDELRVDVLCSEILRRVEAAQRGLWTSTIAPLLRLALPTVARRG